MKRWMLTYESEWGGKTRKREVPIWPASQQPPCWRVYVSGEETRDTGRFVRVKGLVRGGGVSHWVKVPKTAKWFDVVRR